MTFRKVMVLFLVLGICTALSTGCGKKEVKPMDLPDVPHEKMERYVDHAMRYYFHYPNDWKLFDQLPENEHGKTILVSPFEGKEVTRLNISVVAKEYGKVEAKIDDTFLDETKKFYEDQGETVLSLKRGTVKDKYAAAIGMTSKKYGENNVLSKQIIFIADTRLFIITLQGRADLFKSMQKALNDFFENFHVEE